MKENEFKIYFVIALITSVFLLYILVGITVGNIPFYTYSTEETVIVEETRLEINSFGTLFYIKCNSTFRPDFFKIRHSTLIRTSITNGTVLLIEWRIGTVYPLPFFQPKSYLRLEKITIL